MRDGSIDFSGEKADPYLFKKIGLKYFFVVEAELVGTNTDEFGSHARFDIIDSKMIKEKEDLSPDDSQAISDHNDSKTKAAIMRINSAGFGS